MIKLIVAGSRTIHDYEFVKFQIIAFLEPFIHADDIDTLEIVSGGAVGVDQLGERYAAENEFKVKQFLPDWQLYGNQAGFIRNRDMAHYATHCLVLAENESSGSKNMFETARSLGLETKVVHYDRSKVK